ncbi:acetylornithine aminotransferase [Corynebacterium sphenisci DSM 44792]|uniref:Acetylornithine aminotransferase n=1 Tax=Corynebacterium sphenisci DSM 44792 TaxID=1437874 RepID=A0A1L7CYF3_9CORY|nr:acetylornithine transaminase [Corynebacterium sphenisci]APT90854.1 acetylornithine aminotransferase [Corynebacterium sphenisci DSM 44792]
MTAFADRYAALMMDNYGTPRVELTAGRGATLVDAEGREYLDMLAGIAVNALGHGHPAVVEAVRAQIGELGHVSNIFGAEPPLRLADRLVGLTGWDAGETRVLFCNSGTEANEAAFKLARLTGRRRIIAAHHGFHGRTMGALAMTGQPDKRAPFDPMPAGVEFVPYGDIDFLTKTIESDPLGTAAVILEPIQGETGVVAPPEGYFARVRALTERYGVLLIVDEVQTGVGRTGAWFAHQHDGIVPDVMTLAKGLGGGLPLGAVVARGAAAKLFTPGSHGTTFGGNPVCCAAGLAVLDTLESEGLVDRVARMGRVLARKVAALDHVDHVRGRGFMLGVVLDGPLAKGAVDAGYDRGIILNAPQANVLRLVPPLTLSDAEADEAVARIGACLADAAAAHDDGSPTS